MTAAASFFVVGVVLLLWAWGSWIYRTSVAGGGLVAAHMAPSDQAADRAKAVRTMPLFLMVSLLLVLAFFIGSYVLVRASRRYRARRLQSDKSAADRGSTPPAMDDVWSMHKLPEGTDLDEADPPSRER